MRVRCFVCKDEADVDECPSVMKLRCRSCGARGSLRVLRAASVAGTGPLVGPDRSGAPVPSLASRERALRQALEAASAREADRAQRPRRRRATASKGRVARVADA